MLAISFGSTLEKSLTYAQIYGNSHTSPEKVAYILYLWKLMQVPTFQIYSPYVIKREDGETLWMLILAIMFIYAIDNCSRDTHCITIFHLFNIGRCRN